MGMRKDLLDRYDRLVRANAHQLDLIRQRDKRTYELEQELATAKEDQPLCVADACVTVERFDEVKRELDDALERGVAIAKQRSELRTLAGCAEGQDLESRVRELMEQDFVVIAGKRMTKIESLEAQVAGLKESNDRLNKNYAEVVNEREDALDRHKQAHDRAMALHVVIDHAVEELRKVHSEQSGSANRIFAHNAFNILVNDERVEEAAAEVKALRAQCAAVHPAEDMRRWRELAGCGDVETLEHRLEVLQANAGNWEAEALERAQNQTDLENRMDEAVKIINDQPVLTQRDRQALAILVRGEGAEITQAEAWEKTARALNDRINQAVDALQNVTDHSDYGKAMDQALSLLTSDCAGGGA